MNAGARPLRFCLATTFYPPHSFGGDAVAVQRLAEALARRGHAVRVVHDRDPYELLGGAPAESEPVDAGGVGRITMGGSAAGKIDLILSHQLGRPVGRARRLRELLRGFDVVHFHNISLLGGPGVLRYGEGVKLCTLHDYWFICPTHILWRMNREPCERRTCLRCTLAHGRPPQLWRRTGAISRAASEIDAFLVGSEFARRRHVEGGLDGRIEVLPQFVPDDEIERSPRPLRATEDDGQRPFFLVASRLEKAKGVQEAIQAFATFRGADLRIAGRGDFEPRLRETARGMQHVRFLGWQGRDALRDLYRAAAAVIVPSLCYETFGFVALEALAVGTPVVVRDRGALPEIVEATGGGLVYAEPDGLPPVLARLLAHPELGRELGERGRRAVERDFSEARVVERYLALVRDLLSGTGRALNADRAWPRLSG
ncbi:MAG: glycosyltransferase family 4 protein [Gemmatimonadota bacterium]